MAAITPTPPPTSAKASPIRWVLLAVLLSIAVGVAADLRHFAAQDTPITALRTLPVTEASSDDEGSVDAFCGFAPCGMPLECN